MKKYLLLEQYLTIQFLTLLTIFILISGLFALLGYQFGYYWKLLFINMVFMSGIVYLGGFFLAYVYPKNLVIAVDDKKYFIENHTWRWIDIVFHQIPHLLVIGFTILAIENNYWKLGVWNFSSSDLIISLSWITIYFTILNPFNLYFLR